MPAMPSRSPRRSCARRARPGQAQCAIHAVEEQAEDHQQPDRGADAVRQRRHLASPGRGRFCPRPRISSPCRKWPPNRASAPPSTRIASTSSTWTVRSPARGSADNRRRSRRRGPARRFPPRGSRAAGRPSPAASRSRINRVNAITAPISAGDSGMVFWITCTAVGTSAGHQPCGGAEQRKTRSGCRGSPRAPASSSPLPGPTARVVIPCFPCRIRIQIPRRAWRKAPQHAPRVRRSRKW